MVITGKNGLLVCEKEPLIVRSSKGFNGNAVKHNQ